MKWNYGVSLTAGALLLAACADGVVSPNAVPADRPSFSQLTGAAPTLPPNINDQGQTCPSGTGGWTKIDRGSGSLTGAFGSFSYGGSTLTYNIADGYTLQLCLKYSNQVDYRQVVGAASGTLATGDLAGPDAGKALSHVSWRIYYDDTRAEADGPTVSKDGAGTYKEKFRWTLAKDVDKTLVQQNGGSATFNYTVAVTKIGDGVATGSVKATGTITANNPNSAAILITSITDVMSGGTCTVTGGSATSLSPGETTFPYECVFAAVPAGPVDNTVTLVWGAQTVASKSLSAGSASFTFPVSFVADAAPVNGSITVTDVFNPGPNAQTTTSPVFTASGSWNYVKTVPVTNGTCIQYRNDATITGTSISDNETVTVCGTNRNGFTIGYWSNKNGQAQITGIAKSGQCGALAPALNAYGTFEIAASASCAQIVTRVLAIINAANASGDDMTLMLRAQMLATALNVYFSPSLAGTKIDLTNLCFGSGGCKNVSAAFGGASTMTVSQMLTYAAGQFIGGTFYGGVKSTQELAKDAFDAINNNRAFVSP
jgi:hypothetical protein